MRSIHVVGLPIGSDELAPRAIKRINDADVLVGGSRLLARFPDHQGTKVPIKGPLSSVIKRMRSEMEAGRNVVVLADGDPLFYGIGKRMIEALGKENIIFYPNVTALQAAASRIKVPWENVKPVSMHGRNDVWPLLRSLAFYDLVAVYTDHQFGPAKIAEELQERGVNTFRMVVFEDMGLEAERTRVLKLEEARNETFSPLNFVMLERLKRPEIPLALGIDDDLYVHEAGLITKKEVRMVGLGLLQIERRHVVWDLGAGCGSVAIEASLLAREGRVLAVEVKQERVQLIRENLRRTGAYGVEVVYGHIPECIGSLPDPDRVFIGGGLGSGDQVLEAAASRLKPGGRMVIHIVLMGSLTRARDYLQSLGWPVSISQVQVSRTKEIAGDQRLEALNPVFVLSTTKPL